jgi:hypothetical protein
VTPAAAPHAAVQTRNATEEVPSTPRARLAEKGFDALRWTRSRKAFVHGRPYLLPNKRAVVDRPIQQASARCTWRALT